MRIVLQVSHTRAWTKTRNFLRLKVPRDLHPLDSSMASSFPDSETWVPRTDKIRTTKHRVCVFLSMIIRTIDCQFGMITLSTRYAILIR
jgi:hypothetical protein